jgi:general secretion pathway protein D
LSRNKRKLKIETTFAESVSGSATNPLAIGFSTANVEGLIKALEEFGKVRVVKDWSVTALAGKPLFMNEVTEIPYEEQNLSATNAASLSASQVKYKSAGLKLKIFPQIHGNRVEWSIYAEISSLLAMKEFRSAIAPETAKSDVGMSFAVDFGKSVVVSGLKGFKVNKTRNGVPVLQDIPLLGRLFGYASNEETRVEFIVVITPYERVAEE